MSFHETAKNFFSRELTRMNANFLYAEACHAMPSVFFWHSQDPHTKQKPFQAAN